MPAPAIGQRGFMVTPDDVPELDFIPTGVVAQMFGTSRQTINNWMFVNGFFKPTEIRKAGRSGGRVDYFISAKALVPFLPAGTQITSTIVATGAKYQEIVDRGPSNNNYVPPGLRARADRAELDAKRQQQ